MKKTRTARILGRLVLASGLAALVPSALGSTYSTQVLADNPVGYWRLGEAGGPTAVDAAGTNDGSNNGTYAGSVTFSQPGAIAGDADTAATFGIGAVVSVPETAAMDFAGSPLTVEAWATWTSATQFATILMKSTNNGWGDGYGLSANNANSISFWVGSYLNQPATMSIGASSVAFVHIVGTFDGDKARLYKNGVLQTTTDPAGVVTASTGNFLIGEGAGGSSYQWRGKLDEVAVYNHALTDSEILNHYNVGVNIPEPASLALLGLGGTLVLARRR